MMNILSKISQWFKGTPYPIKSSWTPEFLNKNLEITADSELYRLKLEGTDKDQ